MTIAEQIYGIVRALSEAQAAEVLAFVESVNAKHEKEENSLSDNLDDLDKTTWPELVRALAGSRDDDFPTLEEIRAGEVQDAPRESW